MISVSELSIGHGKKPLVRGIDFNLPEGSLSALLGRNGVGKSTLLKTLSKEIERISGNIYIAGKEISDINRKQLSKLLAIVTTEKVNVGGLTVYELIALGRQPHTGFMGRLSDSDHKVITESMMHCGIAGKKDCYVAELSDGERQKTMIARALAQDTPVILLDEPFSFIDAAARASLLSLLKCISREKNKTILFSSHDIGQSLRMSDYILAISNDGRFIKDTPEGLIASNAIDTIFYDSDVEFDRNIMDFVIK